MDTKDFLKAPFENKLPPPLPPKSFSKNSSPAQNPTVAVIVQCRLSSTRLSAKALLPLGEHCVLWYALTAMKKVDADYYYLATDKISAGALAPIAAECGFNIHIGSLDNVLSRFTTLIEKISPDIVLRATADNPFLFTDAARDSLNLFIRANYPKSDKAKSFEKTTPNAKTLLENLQKALCDKTSKSENFAPSPSSKTNAPSKDTPKLSKAKGASDFIKSPYCNEETVDTRLATPTSQEKSTSKTAKAPYYIEENKSDNFTLPPTSKKNTSTTDQKVLPNLQKAPLLTTLPLCNKDDNITPAPALPSVSKNLAPDTKCDYLTLTNLPHGSGIEVFSAKALLTAEPKAYDYDREHVGPALYQHKDCYTCAFVEPPKEYNHPTLRTTIDTPRDYRKALRVQNTLSINSAPYTTCKILEAFENDKKEIVLFVPTTNKWHGTGHLRRACRLARAVQGYVLISPHSTLPNIKKIISDEGLEAWQVLFEDAGNLKEGEFDLIVTDLFKAPRKTMRTLKRIAKVVALDEGGDYKSADYTIDALGCKKARQVNLASFRLAAFVTEED